MACNASPWIEQRGGSRGELSGAGARERRCSRCAILLQCAVVGGLVARHVAHEIASVTVPVVLEAGGGTPAIEVAMLGQSGRACRVRRVTRRELPCTGVPRALVMCSPTWPRRSAAGSW